MLGMAGDLAADLLGPGEARALVPETAPRALP
jgi:hypothetical protein